MAKERQDYRENLALIREAFPDKAVLSIKEVCTFLQRDRRTLLKDHAFPAQLVGGKYNISVVSLARYMS